MSQYSTNLTDVLMMDLQDRTIALETEQFERAVRMSDRLPTEDSQWKTYLNWLLLLGFQAWLSQRAPDLVVQFKDCSPIDPAVANVLDAVCNLEIDGFRICLIRLEKGDDETAKVPRAAIDLPEFAAHFYVLVDVLEEREEISICGALGYDRLRTWQKSHPLQPQPDWTYAIPLQWFDSELTHFVVSLRCRDVYQAALPEVPERSPLLSHQWNEFTATLSRINQTDRPLWEGFTWEQGVKLLTCPDLVRWFYQEQRQGLRESSPDRIVVQPLVNRLNQTAINSWNWAQGVLDEVSQASGWMMQPAFTETLRGDANDGNIRVTQKSYRAAIAALNERGITLPRQNYNAYIDLELGNERLRLRAIPIPALPPEDSQEPVSEWRLFVLLDAQPDYILSQGVTLQVSDETEMLDEQVFDGEAEDAYLFSCVVGRCDEQFTVTIKLADGLSLTLPAFAFQPEDKS